MIDWITKPLNEYSPLYVLIQNWIPPLFSITLGGLFVTILFPRWQDRYVARKVIAERRSTLHEQISASFAYYITCWRRLIQISEYESELAEDSKGADHLAEQKRDFLIERRKSRDLLLDSLSRFKIYATHKEIELIDSFLMWDETQSVKTLTELPRLEEWRRWHSEIVQELGR